MVSNEVQFYEGGNFDSIAHKLHLAKVPTAPLHHFTISPFHHFPISKVEGYSLSPTASKAAHLVAYVPGAKGGPSTCKLFQFPLFAEHQVRVQYCTIAPFHHCTISRDHHFTRCWPARASSKRTRWR